MDMTLYSYFRSSCSWRVRAALSLKGLDYEIEAVNLIKDGGQQLSEDYKKINLMAQVPALKVDDTVITQSLSIMEYLEEICPEPSLLPKTALERAKVREICLIIGSGIQPLQNLSVLQYIAKNEGNEKKLEWAKHVIEKGFEALEKLLVSCSGKYCFGDSITFADCFLVPQIYNAKRFGVTLDRFPTIERIDATLKDHQAFIASHPSNQPDCPSDIKA
ncbi:maleylacetoacetate isomerase-like isoform X2 [Artemia franciscana]|uniref:maleylacetoacetate isomerase-like isoform X2 n=1 Tax=Artemia franciscana TaxID=6661 RepID=UPI0032D9F552